MQNGKGSTRNTDRVQQCSMRVFIFLPGVQTIALYTRVQFDAPLGAFRQVAWGKQPGRLS